MLIFLKINDDGSFEHPLTQEYLKEKYPEFTFDFSWKGNDELKIYKVLYEDEVSNQRNIFQDVVVAEPELIIDGDTKYYVVKKILVDYSAEKIEKVNQAEWVKVRNYRNILLAETDWLSIKSFETGNPIPSEWVTYRQQLRDITTQSNPFNITWPDKPN